MLTLDKTQNWCLVRVAFVAVLAVAAPVGAGAQEHEISRRTYTFLDDRLVVHVESEGPGVLRVVRGERGKVEVAGHSEEGLVGFGLGGAQTRQLRLMSVGGAPVEYLVVVPEHVRLTVQLPERGGSDLGSNQPSALFRWGEPAQPEGLARWPTAGSPRAAELSVIHTGRRAPVTVDVSALAAVRSISVRFEGTEFRIAASRPIEVNPGTGNESVDLVMAGELTDVVLYVPRGTRAFSLRSAGERILAVSGGQPTTECNGVAVQRPTPQQVWYSFYPRAGRLECR